MLCALLASFSAWHAKIDNGPTSKQVVPLGSICSHVRESCEVLRAPARVQVAGGGKMRIRSDDPDYLGHVDRWWSKLLPRMVPLLYQNGGPIVMAQVRSGLGRCPHACHLCRSLLSLVV